MTIQPFDPTPASVPLVADRSSQVDLGVCCDDGCCDADCCGGVCCGAIGLASSSDVADAADSGWACC